MSQIHPTALVDSRAELGEGVRIGAYAIIEGKVELGPGTEVGPYSYIQGPARIGKDNRIGAYVHIGGAPQHREYQGEETGLEIGDENLIREFVTIHRGTALTGITRVGSGNFIMVGVHIAHDCKLGNNLTIANYVQIAGHCQIDDYAVFGGLAGVHQHCRVGKGAMVAALSGVSLDVPPYSVVGGERARFVGLNRIGLKRMGMAEEVIRAIRRAYRIISQPGVLLKDALAQLEQELGEVPEVREIIDFYRSGTRGVIRR